jgi:hypothetical protein
MTRVALPASSGALQRRVIGSGPWQSSVGVLPGLGVAVLAEIEGIELIECLTSVDAEVAECLVEGPTAGWRRGRAAIRT